MSANNVLDLLSRHVRNLKINIFYESIGMRFLNGINDKIRIPPAKVISNLKKHI